MQMKKEEALAKHEKLCSHFHLFGCSTPHLCFQHKAWSRTWLQKNKDSSEISSVYKLNRSKFGIRSYLRLGSEMYCNTPNTHQ